MKVLVLGDVHLPFTNWDCVEAAAEFAKDYKPDLIIQVGDLIDQYNWSLFRKSPDAPSAAQEFEQTVECFHRLMGMFPKKVPWRVLEGNHCRRHMLRAFDCNLPKQLIKSLDDVLVDERVVWHLSTDPLVADKVTYIHGDEMGGNAWQKAQRMGTCLVQGHDHLGYLQYINTFKSRVFGMSVGTLMDSTSIAGRYAAKNPMKCFLGWATVEDGTPHLYPW